MNKPLKLILVGLAILVIGLIAAGIRSSILAQDSFQDLLSGARARRIVSLSIKGQQRQTDVSDPEVLSLIQAAFAVRSTNVPQTGIAYEITFTFSSGAKVETFLYLYEAGNGFSIADQFHKSAGDPRMIDVRFSQPLDIRLKKLVEYLLGG